jgi:hypothetical protein
MLNWENGICESYCNKAVGKEASVPLKLRVGTGTPVPWVSWAFCSLFPTAQLKPGWVVTKS